MRRIKLPRRTVRKKPLPTVLSEGDSWFDYPLHFNLMDYLKREILKINRGTEFIRLERNGDEVLTMMSGSQKSKLRKILKENPIKLILFSGGGNDVIGQDLSSLLLPPPRLWNRLRINRKLRQVELAYMDLIALRDDYRPEATIVVHSYDYAIPSDKPVKLGPLELLGPWMLPEMLERGIGNTLDQMRIARLLIDEFYYMLKRIEEKTDRFIVVDTRGLLKEDEWADEIHPTSKGFRKVAVHYRPTLTRLLKLNRRVPRSSANVFVRPKQ